jgi:signal transduction histidine kinase
VLSLYQGRIGNSKITVEKSYRSQMPVRCYEGEARQVISNLVSNALDAISPGAGRLTLRVRDGRDQRSGRRGLILTVADTGRGMPPTVAHRVFQPFFTTKGFVGTGLGLWITQEIVGRHTGTILLRTCQREGRSGTVFSVFLPFDAVYRNDATLSLAAQSH